MSDNSFECGESGFSQGPVVSRRRVLAGLASAGVVTIIGTSPVGGAIRALAMPGSSDDQVLVNVFLRGGADGLNIVVPYGDGDYYRLRGSIAQARNSLSDLNGFFGLNQAFSKLHPLYREGEVAFVQAVGSNDPTRSHFSAMDNMDLAFGSTGWMQRALMVQAGGDPLAGLSIGSRISPSLRGPAGGIAVDRLSSFRKSMGALDFMRPTLESMYDGISDPLTGLATVQAFTSIDRLSNVTVQPSVTYPRNSVGRDLQEAAALIKANVGVRMVSVNIGGWDHHKDENARMTTKGTQLAEALAAFKADLAGDSERVLTLVMSEFGRTAAQNGSGGTDHGHGGMMMLMGGKLAQQGGGRVHLRNNSWVGLSKAQLHEGRDLAISTDFRSVLGEALQHHMGIVDNGLIFPGYQPQYLNYLSGDGAPPPPPPGSTTTTTAAPGTSTTVPSTDPTSGSSTTVTTTGVSTTAVATTAVATTATTAGSSTTAPSTTGPSTTGPSTTAPSTTGPSTTGPSTTGSSTTVPATTAPPTTVPGGWISGVVKFVDGLPAPGTKIDLFRADSGMRDEFLGTTKTDDNGEYLFESPSGPHILTFIAPPGDGFTAGRRWHQPSVRVEPGQTTSGINATLLGTTRSDGGKLSGQITDGGGQSMAAVKVDLFTTRADGARGRFLRTMLTDQDGRFLFQTPGGCYTMTMIAPEGRLFSNGRRWHQPSICIEANEARTDIDGQLQ